MHLRRFEKIDDVRLEADTVNVNVDGLEALASTQQADIALIKADVDDIRADLANGVTINQPVAITDNGGTLTVDGTVTANGGDFVGEQSDAVAPSKIVQIGWYDEVNGEFLRTSNNFRFPVGNGVLESVVKANGDTPNNAVVVAFDNDGFAQIPSATNPLPISGTVTAAQATAANLNATVVQSTATNLRTQAESYQGGTAVGSGNPLQVTLANTGANTTALRVEPKNGAVTRTTGDTATANTSKEALASSSSRRYLLIQNISDTDMYFNFGATATTDNMLITKNGGGIVFESGYVPTDAVNVICSGADKKYFILSA